MDAFLTEILGGFSEIWKVFAKGTSIWWLLAPLILFWFALEIYFGKYKKEKLGWNTALGNALSIFWLIIVSVMKMFEIGLKEYNLASLFFLLAICIYTLFIIIFTFAHKLKEDFDYLIASPTPIYFLSMVAVLISHGPLIINRIIIIDLVILFIFVLLFGTILKHITPESTKDEISDLGKSDFNDFGKMDSGLGNNNLNPNLRDTSLGNIR